MERAFEERLQRLESIMFGSIKKSITYKIEDQMMKLCEKWIEFLSKMQWPVMNTNVADDDDEFARQQQQEQYRAEFITWIQQMQLMKWEEDDENDEIDWPLEQALFLAQKDVYQTGLNQLQHIEQLKNILDASTPLLNNLPKVSDWMTEISRQTGEMTLLQQDLLRVTNDYTQAMALFSDWTMTMDYSTRKR